MFTIQKILPNDEVTLRKRRAATQLSITLPDTGFLRISEVLRYIPLSKSSFYQYVNLGKFPRPIKLGDRASAWKAEDIRKLIADLSNGFQESTEDKSCE